MRRDAAGERVLQRESNRVVTLAAGGDTVRKTFIGTDADHLFQLARREYDRLRRFSEALEAVEGAGCPEAVELSDGPQPSLTMTRAPGLPMAEWLRHGADQPEVERLVQVLCAGLITYVTTFSEPYYDFHFRNMLYDPSRRQVMFLDFGVPDQLLDARPALDQLAPIDASLGNLYGSSLFEAVRPRNLHRIVQNRRLLALSMGVIKALMERDAADPDMRPTLSGIEDAMEVAYSGSASWGPWTHQLWYRVFPGRMRRGKQRLEKLFASAHAGVGAPLITATMVPASSGLGVRAALARTQDNKHYWESVGGRYNAGWKQPVMAAMSQRERAMVLRTLSRTPGRRVLDIGVGNGRILDTVLQAASVESVYGVDIAEEMVKVCREKYAGEPRVSGIMVCDLSHEPLPFNGPFDFVSAIRVLKYSANWREVLAKVAPELAQDGLFLFSMPNRNSLNRFSRYPVPTYTATQQELTAACSRAGLRVVEITGFSKIPTRFYLLSERTAYRDLIVKAESALDAALGSATLGRELFVVAQRSDNP